VVSPEPIARETHSFRQKADHQNQDGFFVSSEQGAFMHHVFAVVLLGLAVAGCNSAAPPTTEPPRDPSAALNGKVVSGWDGQAAELYSVYNQQNVRIAGIAADGSFKAQWPAPAANDLNPGNQYNVFASNCNLTSGSLPPQEFGFRFSDAAVFRGQTPLGTLGGFSGSVVAGGKSYILVYFTRGVTVTRTLECRKTYINGGAFTERYREAVTYKASWNLIVFTYTKVSTDGTVVDTQMSLSGSIPTETQWYLQPPNPASAKLSPSSPFTDGKR
jgi:hypothetical protein